MENIKNRPVKKTISTFAFLLMACTSPQLLWAQDSGLAGDIQGLHSVLDQLYQQMMPLCSQLIGVGSAIAGFAALWYIAARV